MQSVTVDTPVEANHSNHRPQVQRQGHVARPSKRVPERCEVSVEERVWALANRTARTGRHPLTKAGAIEEGRREANDRNSIRTARQQPLEPRVAGAILNRAAPGTRVGVVWAAVAGGSRRPVQPPSSLARTARP
eukprot:1097856-Rhodomonas_salina.1